MILICLASFTVGALQPLCLAYCACVINGMLSGQPLALALS